MMPAMLTKSATSQAADGWNMFGMPRPDRAEYEKRARALSSDLDLPNELLRIIAEYGSTLMCTFMYFRIITFCFDRIKTSIKLSNGFQRFKNIQILASVLIDRKDHFDLLSNYTWRSRSYEIIRAYTKMYRDIGDRVSITDTYPRDSYLICDQNGNEVCEWGDSRNLHFEIMHHNNEIRTKIEFAASKF